MAPSVAAHTLVRIGGVAALNASDAPPWVSESLQRAPWVVVRRALCRDGLIPVGVRGAKRAQRFASWVSKKAIVQSMTPCALATLRGWASSSRRSTIPALAALDAVEHIMHAHGWLGRWGPTGSVGFELASGQPTANLHSDLDLALQLDRPPSVTDADVLVAALAALPVRVDVLLELSQGAVALADYVRSQGGCVLRTTQGPRLLPTA